MCFQFLLGEQIDLSLGPTGARVDFGMKKYLSNGLLKNELGQAV